MTVPADPAPHRGADALTPAGPAPEAEAAVGAEVEGPVGARHLSPTSAATFNQCPKRWRYRYVEGLPDPPGIPALVGTLAHRVLELLLNEPADRRHPERARQLATEAWPAHAERSDFTELALDAAATRAFKWRVWTAIEGLWRVEDPRAVKVRATEQRLEVTVAGVPFVGIVDRVDHHADGIVITDYKSGQPPAPGRVEEKLDQVLLYAAAVADSTGERPVRARLLYLGATVVEVEATPAALDRATSRLADTWEALQAAEARGAYPANAGPLCGWCPYLDHCQEGQAGLRTRAEAGWLLPAHAPAAAFRHVA
jgi:putative RecB family exonuclease